MTTFAASASIQSFTSDTQDAYYRIVARGAAGGGSYGGFGAIITADVLIPANTVLSVVAPTRPPSSGGADWGGGGGAFVYAGSTLYVAAGGGGGTHGSTKQSQQDASLTTSGKSVPGGGAGGTGGQGGAGGTTNSWAGGGAGWLSNGGDGSNNVNTGGKSKAYSVPWQGGGGQAGTSTAINGGYGGGGGTHGNTGGGAGGGGYSGGGGGHQTDATGAGGGGGSYNTGTLVSASVDTSLRDGEVTITFLRYANTSPSATITAPSDGIQVDPRSPLTVTLSYSDSEGDAQVGWQVDYSADAGTTWTSAGSGTTENTVTIAANTLTDETDYLIRARVQDAVAGWGAYDQITIHADSWAYLTAVSSSTQSGTLDTTSLTVGDYEVEVHTADAVGFGPWSSPATFTVLPPLSVYVNGSWQLARKYLMVNGSWVDVPPTRKVVL